jgi:hypothetical protein
VVLSVDGSCGDVESVVQLALRARVRVRVFGTGAWVCAPPDFAGVTSDGSR